MPERARTETLRAQPAGLERTALDDALMEGLAMIGAVVISLLGYKASEERGPGRLSLCR